MKKNVRILFVGGIEKTYEDIDNYEFDENEIKFTHVMVRRDTWTNKRVIFSAHIIKSQIMSVEFFETED